MVYGAVRVNILKKVERGDFTLDEKREDIGKELADAQTYLDILAARLDISLEDATIEKFDEVSRRVSCDIFLGDTVCRVPIQRRWRL